MTSSSTGKPDTSTGKPGTVPVQARPGRSGLNRTVKLVAGALLALVIVWIAAAGSNHLLGLATVALMFGAISGAWAMAGGLGGLFSLGHAAFFGIGAYTTAFLFAGHGVSPWLGMVAGVVLAAVFGACTTWLSVRFRVRGSYFALVTLAWAEMLRVIVSNVTPLGRSNGILVPYKAEPTFADLQFSDPRAYYALAVLYAVVVTVIFMVVKRTRFGWRLSAVRGDEDAAAASGVDVRRVLVAVMALSAAVTAAGGTLYVQYMQFIDPELAFSPTVSIDIAIRAVIGGPMVALGPLAGSGAMTTMTEWLKMSVSDSPAMNVLLFGVAVILAGRYFRNGLAGIGASALQWIGRRKERHDGS
ncbi:branched-chain amino acid ABC transporter permease [Streptosporangium violaceochromogenes]|nr:branched-chain amino acid ABC transporter permease [Streptosporangium violaceochromogenes]